MKRTMITIAAAFCVAAYLIPSTSVFAASDRIAMPVYTMGAFDSQSPESLDIALSSQKLAFKGITLDQLKTMVDDGYEIFGYFFGAHVNSEVCVPCYNLQYYPTTGAPTMIAGDFCLVDGGFAKAVCVTFTDGDDGVYVTATKATYKTGAAASYKFVTLNADGTLTYNERTADMALSTSWDEESYGVGAIQCAKFVPSAESMLVWSGVTLDDVKGRRVYGCLGGKDAANGYECASTNTVYACDDSGSVTNICTELQYLQDATTKCVVVQLTNGADGVYAKVLAARSADEQESIGYGFVNSDGTYNGTEEAVSTSFATAGYGVYGLYAASTCLADVSFSSDVSSTARLVWSGVTLDDVKGLYFQGYFSSGNMAISGGKGIGFNRRITYDSDGKATKIVEEFQRIDSGAAPYFIKCVVVAFTNGADGVYASRLTGRYKQVGSYVLGGYRFVNDNGSYNGSNSTAYNVHGLHATTCIKLTGDKDWSSFGSVDLKGEIVDLNGHTLTANGLKSHLSSMNDSHMNLVNSARDTTATLKYYTFGGDTCKNDSARLDSDKSQGGAMRLLKDGSGTLIVDTNNNLYRWGTTITNGTLKSGTSGSNLPFGLSGGSIQVEQGGAFNSGSYWSYTMYKFVMNGGTYEDTDLDCVTGAAQIQEMTLTADSTMSLPRCHGFIGASYGAATLDLGGHTLTVNLGNDSKNFYLINTTIKNGTLYIASGGYLYTYRTASDAKTANLHLKAAMSMHVSLSVNDYVALYNATTANYGTAVLSVYGTFKPKVDRFYGPTMQNGSTMDFSEWPGNWPVSNAFSGGSTKINFASGAVVAVKLGEKRPTSGKILSWSSVPDATFVRGDEDRIYSLLKKDDGLYIQHGMALIVR